MNTRSVFRSLPAWALGVGLGLAAPAFAADAAHVPAHAPAHAPAAPALLEEDVSMFELVPGTVYLNGGIGQDEQQRMQRDARHWPLRLTFSDRANHEFVAGVQLKIFNHDGQAVLRLKDAGPLTYVQLPQGDYRVQASYRGERLVRQLHVGAQGLDANFHWAL